MVALVDKNKNFNGEVIKEWESGLMKIKLVCGDVNA